MSTVSIHAPSRTIVGPTWRLKASVIEERPDRTWMAEVGVTSQLTLRIESRADGLLDVEAWSGVPESSKGIAAVSGGDAIAGLVAIPCCECGDQLCANSGRQLRGVIVDEKLFEVVEALRALPALPGDLRPGQLWRDDLLTGLCLNE